MGQNQIQDRMCWGMNRAAQAVGNQTDVYRPCGQNNPLAPENRFLKLPALFSGARGRFERPNQYGGSLCHGIFDAAYTHPGDYLAQPNAVWFVASQEPLLPVLCVRTNRVVSLQRPDSPSGVGDGGYGGVTAETRTSLLENWPASVLGASSGGRAISDLPSDGDVSQWIVLLPCSAEVTLRPADLMSDDLGRSAIVCSAERSELGWRLMVKQATT